MKPNTVTIGITTYNAEDTVREALQSAFDQSIPIEQIIVIDDVSSDRTMSILAEYAHHSNLEVHRNPENRGVAASRNEIIKRATGDFVAFFDDDDISAPNRVEAQLARIVEYEAAFADGAPVICHTARLQIYPDGEERIEPTMGCRIGRPAPSGRAVVRRALMGEPLEDGYGSCATCSQMARTATYRMLSGFDEAFRRVGDSEIAIRFALAGGHFVGISEPLVTQRMTGTSEKGLEALKGFNLMLLKKHRQVFDDEVSYEFCREWTKLKFDWLAGDHPAFVLHMSKLGLRHPIFSVRRIWMAMPNMSGNRTFSRFARGRR